MISEPWTKKYEPKTVKDVTGQDKALNELKVFVNNFKSQKKRAALLYGPPGSGKTCSVYALANDLSLEIVEINASDVRNKAHINSIVGAATKQMSLFAKGKLILVDEVDGLSGTKDRGGLQALLKLISQTSFPVVLTITNPWDFKFNSLRNKTAMIQFHALNYLSVHNVLKRICKQEKIGFDDTTLKNLARRAGGDTRAAINDLYTISQETKKLTKESLDVLGERNRTETMISALVKVFKTTDPNIAITAFDNVEEDFDKIFLWIDENLPKEYTKPQDLWNAYNVISKADVFNRRIKRRQHWRFLVYINALLSAGIATAKKEKYNEFVAYKPTTRLLKLWHTKMRYQKRKAIAQKIAEHTHSSTKQVIQNTMPYLQVIFKNNKTMAADIAEELELEKEEIDWLKKR